MPSARPSDGCSVRASYGGEPQPPDAQRRRTLFAGIEFCGHSRCEIDQIAKATHAPRIPYLARAATSSDMLANASGSSAGSSRCYFSCDRCLGFTEAVANRALARRPLLPHRYAHISRREDLLLNVEIDDRAMRVGTESVRASCDRAQRRFRKQRLDGEQLDSTSLVPITRTSDFCSLICQFTAGLTAWGHGHSINP